jgi:1-phosphatidylinositol-3-phosphate 5-kinase
MSRDFDHAFIAMLLVSLDYPTIAEIRTDKDISLKTQERPSLHGDPVYGQMDARTAPAPVLTTFPNPFDDEEEQGYIPSLLSKFKNTFTPAPTASLVAPIQEQREQATNQRAPASDDIPTKRQSTVPSASTNTRVTQPRTSSATNLTSFRKQATRPTKSSVQSYSSLQSIAPLNPSVTKAPPSFSRNFASREIAPPVVSITPVVSVTDAGHATHEEPVAGPSRSVMHAHFSSSTPIQTGSGARYRRPSVSTIPDSPSSASLSGIAANAELSQNFSHVPGFPMADDTRSIRTSGSIKRNGSVSKIIRRLRGEGLR